MLIAIWAQAEDGLIGQAGHLPWHLPVDLQYFKEQTLGKTIVMGRKSFEGMGSRALPKRKTLLLTSDHSYQVADANVQVMHQVSEVLDYAKTAETPVYIAGGAQVYKAFEPYYDVLLRTVIEGEFQGDTYFPDFDFSGYRLVETRPGVVDEKNHYPHHFEMWQKR